MKKLLKLALATALFAAMVTGCSTSSHMAYTYSVDTGDDIRVGLDTKDGYKLSPDVPFVVSVDGEELSKGIFVWEKTYGEYVKAAEAEDDHVTLIEKGETDTIEYVFWSYDDEEYNYAIHVKDSSTGIILGNATSQESAEEVFSRLEFECVD